MVLKRGSALRLFAVALALVVWCALPSSAQARKIRVAPTGSTSAIQAAVDEAAPGDTIVVAPGTYSGPTIGVRTSGLTITGSRAAIIDATGDTYGITVGTQLTFDPGPACPAYGVSDFSISGLSVRNAEDTGIFLFGVDRFEVSGGNYLDNGEYGIFPRCSRDGLISKNFGGGGNDATIYVGVDKNTVVEKNRLVGGELGIELENTNDTVVRNNLLSDNTTGIFVIVLPNLPTSST